jgi:hypothetical protein
MWFNSTAAQQPPEPHSSSMGRTTSLIFQQASLKKASSFREIDNIAES